MRIAVDFPKCTGCRLCQEICAIEHYHQINPKKAALNIVAEFPSPGVYKPMVCTQCGTCAEVCPVDAIVSTDGVYRINEDDCILCLQCVEACPEQCMRVHSDLQAPTKCDYCMKCTEVCNTGALTQVP